MLPAVTDRRAVGQYFNHHLGLHPSDDFRGVCHFAPTVRAGDAMVMDDVAVAVGYDNFIGRVCCMHTVIARPECVTRRIVREAFEFPFMHCDCEAVIALVDSTNVAALTFDTRLGFKECARIAHAGLEGDLVIMRMLRGECRWLRPH